MPIPKPPTTIEAASFIKSANPDSIPGVQANETFMLTATNNGALGNGGESIGFAKYQFDGVKLVQSQKDINTLGEVLSGTARTRNGLHGAIGGDSAELLQTKLDAAVKHLKKHLPEDQHAGVDAIAADPQQVVAAMDDLSVSLTGRQQAAATAFEALDKVAKSADDLFDPSGEIPPDRALLARSVASSQVDQLLGTNCVAEETFGVDSEHKIVGISIQGDGAGVTGKYRPEGEQEKKDYVLQVDLARPETQRGLADLEAVDYLTGQIDRHCGNIFVDKESGKVTGIDNDLAFPELSREQTLANIKSDAGEAMANKSVAGMPMQMHKDTAQKILALSPDTLREHLQQMQTPDGIGKLSDAAIDSACGRLVQMQNELKQPGGAIKVVDQFNDETYAEAMAAQEAAVEQKIGTKLAGATVDHDGDLNGCPKTSYLGSVAVQAKRYEIAAQVTPDQFGVRPMSTVTKAPRNAELADYSRQLDLAKKTLAASPASLGAVGGAEVRQQAQSLHNDIAALKEKMAHYDKEVASLEKNKIGSLVRSLASGGSSNRKEFYADKKLEAQQQIGNIQRQLEGLAENAMTNELKAELRESAKAAALKVGGAPQVAQNDVAQNPFLAQQAPEPPALEQPVAAQDDVGQFPFLAEQAPSPPGLNQPSPAPKAAQQPPKQAPLPKSAEDEQEVSDPDDLDDDLEADVKVDAEVKAELEVKKEGLAKKPSVAEMLKRTNSAPQLGGHKAAQGVGGEEPKPAGGSLRASGGWQAAKPSGPKPGGGSLSASRP